MKEILLSSEVIAAIVGVVLGAVFTYLFNRRNENNKKSQIKYAKKAEVALRLAKDELKEKLHIIYNGTEISQLNYFYLKLENTGKRTIRNQAFTCLFDSKTEIIDPVFPRITTIPTREVGPIIQDNRVKENNEFRFIVETLGVGQVVKIEFLTIGNKTNSFDVIFKPNDLDEVSFTEGYYPYEDDELTPREAEITGMIMQDMPVDAIAAKLNMTPEAVKTILFRVYKKKGVKSRSELLNKLQVK